MTILHTLTVFGLAVITVLHSSPSFGQVAEACGTEDELLFYCTIDSGAQQVGLCLSNDTITYSFGPRFSAPELSMTRAIMDVEYFPFARMSNTAYERVTLFNENTSYTVFSSQVRGSYDSLTEGGITVKLPDQAARTLDCDTRTVWPHDPYEGIGKLTYFITSAKIDPISRCLRLLPDLATPAQCLGRYRDIEIRSGKCNINQDGTQCWQHESDQWSLLMSSVFAQAIKDLKKHPDTQLAPSLKASQESWKQTRDLDCQISGILPFSPDSGVALCKSKYTANRIQFLYDAIAYAEFDG